MTKSTEIRQEEYLNQRHYKVNYSIILKLIHPIISRLKLQYVWMRQELSSHAKTRSSQYHR